MPGVLIGALYQYFFGISLFVVSLFMILLILVQRGRGGGLTGALGGAGGQSAFGAKAGDLFTRLTSVWALAWFLLCIFAIMANEYYSNKIRVGPGSAGNSSAASDPLLDSDTPSAESEAAEDNPPAGGVTAPEMNTPPAEAEAPESGDGSSK